MKVLTSITSTASRAGAAALRCGLVVLVVLLAAGALVIRAAHLATDVEALHRAAAGDDLDALATQVARVPDLDARDPSGFTPLAVAARHGRTAAVEMLLSRGAAVDAAHPALGTPLMLALSNGHAEAARVLLAGGADVHAQHDGYDALASAVRGNCPECLELVLGAGADPCTAGRRCNVLTLAAHDAGVAVLRRLLEAGANPNLPDSDGTTPLFAAVDCQSAEAARALLGAGADADHAAPGRPSARALARHLGRGDLVAPRLPEPAGAPTPIASQHRAGCAPRFSSGPKR